VWEEEKTKEKFEDDAEGKLPVLVEDKKREIKTDPDKPTHILIEGDNYHALSVLNYTHAKSIDVIYIDPPYNTGARDWKYNNDYVEKEDAYRQSKWLSFMNNRLKLAKKLLKTRGVLICTIDENEHATLGLLLQEIFPDKEIVCITIIHNPAGVQGKNFSYTHEYAYFIYPKNGEFIEKTTRENELVSPLRDWGTISKREQAKTCFYPIVVKENKIISFEDVCPDDFHPESSNVIKKDGTIWIYPIDKHGIERKWVFSKKGVEKIKEQLFCKKIGKEYVIMRKKELFTYRTVWNDKRYYANIYGSKLLNQIIKSRFPFPKSLYAVADCIKAVIHNKADATILDFFAGSGTTGHAVLMLNDEDGGKRQFILSTNNENNICTDICYPRVKKVLQGYKSIKGEKVQGFGGNLKYYKTDFVGSEPTHRNKKLLTNKSIEMLCLKENTFDEVMDKENFFIFKSKVRFTAILFNDSPYAKVEKRQKRC
jgi:adenine-specific DNA-methyltransferase